MKTISITILMLLSLTMSGQMYIGASITPTFNNKLGLNKSIATFSVEYAIDNTSFFVAAAVDKVKIGFIFGNTIQFSCAYVQTVDKELTNSVELGFRYRIKTKLDDIVEIGSYVELDTKAETKFLFMTISVGFKKMI